MGIPWDFQFDDTSDDLHLDKSYQIAVTETLEDIIAVRIRTRLRLIAGECYLDRDRGVPYFSEVNKKNPDIARVRNLLLSEVVSVEGVKQVLRFDVTFDPASRVLRVEFRVLVDTGIVVEGEI